MDLKAIEFWIDASGYSRRQLSRMLGHNPGYLDSLLRGKNKNPSALIRLAGLLGLPLEAFFHDPTMAWLSHSMRQTQSVALIQTQIRNAISNAFDYLTVNLAPEPRYGDGMDSYLLDRKLAIKRLEDRRPSNVSVEEFRALHNSNIESLVALRETVPYVHRMVVPMSFLNVLPYELLQVTKAELLHYAFNTQRHTSVALVQPDDEPRFFSEIAGIVGSGWTKISIMDDKYFSCFRKFSRDVTFDPSTIRDLRTRIESVVARYTISPWLAAQETRKAPRCNRETLAYINFLLKK